MNSGGCAWPPNRTLPSATSGARTGSAATALPPAGVLVEDRSEAADAYAAMTGRSCRSDGTWTERSQVQMIRFGSPRNSQPIGQDRVQIVRARPKPRRQSRYVIGLPAILAELCRIVHR